MNEAYLQSADLGSQSAISGALIPPWPDEIEVAHSVSSSVLPAPNRSWELPELRDSQVPSFQRCRSEELQNVGLWNKARRHRVCGLIAKKRVSDICGKRFYIRFCCGNRYCPVCAKKIFERLFNKYWRILRPVTQRLVPEWPISGRKPKRMIAKVDITLRNTGEMPLAKDVRRFNRCVKALFREVERLYCATPVHVGYRIPAVKDRDGKPRKSAGEVSACAGFEERVKFALRNGGVVRFSNEGERLAVESAFRAANRATKRKFWRIFDHDYGFLWCDEFGGKAKRPLVNRGLGNTNLHAHGVYAGPWIPQSRLSALWRKISRGSFVVSIGVVRSPQAALGHALEYAGKFLSQHPARLAQLEKAFNGARRVHAVGAFYDAEMDGTEEQRGDSLCPCGCGGRLLHEDDNFESVFNLIVCGYRDLDEARREFGRARIFCGARSP